MTNILFVSIAFPPKCDAEGLQVAKYLKYILQFGEGSFAVDAVTSTLPTMNMPLDVSLETVSRGVRQIVELPILENRYSNYLIRKLLPLAAAMPDPKFTFSMQAGRVVKELQVKPDLIYSRACPFSSSVLAYRLKRIFSVPWVMHLSDLWADCPERNFRGISKVVQERLEKMCFETADVICVTSEKTLEFYKKKYKYLGPRIELYPNVFDPEDVVTGSDLNIKPMSARKTNEKFRIVHTGSLVGERSAAPLLRALMQLNQEIQDNIELFLVGPIDRINSKLVRSFNLPFIKLIDQVEFKTALEMQRGADLLILIDTPIANPDLRVYFRSKLLDYMLCAVPILAIGDKNSQIEKVMSDLSLGKYIYRDDIESISEYVKTAVHCPVVLRQVQKNHIFEEYSADHNTKRLLSLFQELTSRTALSQL